MEQFYYYLQAKGSPLSNCESKGQMRKAKESFCAMEVSDKMEERECGHVKLANGVTKNRLKKLRYYSWTAQVGKIFLAWKNFTYQAIKTRQVRH